MLPTTTRLRYVRARNPDVLTLFCDSLGKRIEVKSISKDGPYWVLWFIPDDTKSDVRSGEIVLGKNTKGQTAIGYVKK